MEHKLTPDEWKIYNYLKDHNNKWIQQEDLAYDLFYNEWLNDVKYSETDFHNTAIRKKITNAIRNLNNSPIIQKIILSSSKGVKIAERDEIDKYIGRHINCVVARLNRLKLIAKKASRDGQYKITFGKYERQIIEAFPKDND